MGEKSSLNLISDGIAFQPLPTSDNPKSSGFTSQLPVVLAARKLKRQRQIQILTLCVAAIAVVAIILAVTLSMLDVQEATETKVEATKAKVEETPRSHENFRQPRNEDFLPIGTDLMNLARSSADIGMKLYHQEMQKNTGNLLFSPFSIQTALSMVSLGSKASTLDQLMTFLGGAKDGGLTIENLSHLKHLYGLALPALQSNNNYTIETANLMFIQKDFQVLEDLTSDLRKYFQTSIATTDYRYPQVAADLINNFVEEETMNKIHNLVSPSSLNADTKVVLANALYFKGLWTDTFDKQQTRTETFHISESEYVEAEFMHQAKELNVGEFKGRSIIALPYSGDRYTMYLFLPHTLRDDEQFDESYYYDDSNESVEHDEPLSELENALLNDPQGLSEALQIKNFSKKKLDLLLPKFKIESTMELKDNLQKLGVTAPFSALEADLSGITGIKDLFLSDALHKAFLEVTEEGSEAAAATGMIMASRMLMLPPPAAHFDRPFVFFIKDELTGLMLFQGRIVNPTI